jgi:hypothetical protein
MPEPGTYQVCPNCSVRRNVRTAPRCPICAIAEIRSRTVVRERRPNRGWSSRTTKFPVEAPLPAEVGALVQSVDDAFRWVSERHGVSRDELVAHNRRMAAVRARFELIYLLRSVLGLSSLEAGRVLDRDHSTILYADFQYRRAFPLSTGGESGTVSVTFSA